MSISRKEIESYVLQNLQLRFRVEESELDKALSAISVPIYTEIERVKGLESCGVEFSEFRGENIPYFFSIGIKNNGYQLEKGVVHFQFDVYLAIFFFLSGYQEVKWGSNGDTLGRFKFEDSIQSALNFALTPVVDYYYIILAEALKELGLELIPHQSSTQVFLTHDVDNVWGWKQDAFHALKNKNLSRVFTLGKNHLLGNDEWKNLLEIAALELQYGFKSCFYFLTERGTYNNLPNADYSFTSKYIQESIKELRGKGFIIGLHGALNSFGDTNYLAKQKNDFVANVQHHRFHFLHYTLQNSIKTMEDVGLDTDSSMGWAEQPGFRMGTCFPYLPYCFEKNTTSSLVEIPLVLMDTTLNSKAYLNTGKEGALNIIKETFKAVNKVNGVFTVLWHNNYFTSGKFAGWGKVYENLLADLKANEVGDFTQSAMMKYIQDRVS